MTDKELLEKALAHQQTAMAFVDASGISEEYKKSVYSCMGILVRKLLSIIDTLPLDYDERQESKINKEMNEEYTTTVTSGKWND
jgi:hypothetical protein